MCRAYKSTLARVLGSFLYVPTVPVHCRHGRQWSHSSLWHTQKPHMAILLRGAKVVEVLLARWLDFVSQLLVAREGHFKCDHINDINNAGESRLRLPSLQGGSNDYY